MKLSKKVENSISKYINISDKYVITIGIFHNGLTDFLTIDKNNINKNIYDYDIGSISKTFTAHLILKLHEENKLNINDSIDKYLELKPNKYPKIIDLLSHSAGYNNLTPFEITIPSLLLKNYSKKNIYENITNEKVIKCLERRKLKNNKYGYSDFAFAVLAIIASKVSNRSFDELFNSFIKEDLKLDNTFLNKNNPRNLLGYIKDKKVEFWKWNDNNPYISAGGIVSNITDMLNYIKIQIESNSPYIINAHCNVNTSNNIVACLGWHSYTKSNQLWHVGGVGTFRSSIIINKKKKFGVIVLGNAKGIRNGNVHYIAKQIYSEFKKKKVSV